MANSGVSMIRVEQVTFEYPGFRALDDISFEIPANQVVALVGPNGAGKTTLMRCICGLERPIAGDIHIDGINVIEHPRESHRKVGFLSDFFGLYAELTVSQCLRHAATANGRDSNIASAVLDTARRLKLEDRLDQPAGELSRGLRQRVAIGQAIIHKPEVLILDEPASGLDPEARHDLAQVFKTLQSDGMTLMVSSHILAELEEYADAMLVLRDGHLVEHRNLTEATIDSHFVVIQPAAAYESMAPILEADDNVGDVYCDESGVQCRLQGGEESQVRLLKSLVDAGIGIASFAPVGRDLQQSYLETIKSTSRSS